MESRHKWILPRTDRTLASAAAALCRALDLPEVVARILCQRGYRDAHTVRLLLTPSLEQLLDPLLMTDMDRAVERLVRAVRGGEHIVVNGDYDADGVTGTALLVSELRKLGGRVDFFIPDRERDGYGITPRLVRRAGEVGVRVLVSVDCGSSDHEAIETARSLGIDVVVVDHHEIPRCPEAAWAVLNPKRSDCSYPFKSLSAVGVAYKLLQAVHARLLGTPAPDDGLDLVALGTLADVQPVVEENRVLTALGLQRLASQTLRPGIRALRAAAGVRADDVRSGHVGFRMAPRLNAVGRVARGKLAVDLLLAADDAAAGDLVRQVEGQNQRRRQLQQRVVDGARERAAGRWREARRASFVFASDAWHPGVVGIAAARLADEYGVPVVLIGIQGGVGRGSARTAGDVDVRAVLDAAADLLVRYGGHREACGLTIEPQRVTSFAERFDAAVRARRDTALERSLVVDAELGSEDLQPDLIDALDRLEPFGVGNPEPLFVFRGMQVRERTRVVGEGHLKLDLEFPGGGPLDGIAFGWGRDVQPGSIIGTRLDAVGHVRRQDPRFGEAFQLVVSDLRSHPNVANS
ncbi:MAG: single-stranded-DNA-specific exonuclease RecJ [Candidatus Krumholzibacteriia bacterium]